MTQRVDPSRDLLRLAHLQGGVVTTEQASGLGLGRHSITRLLSAHQWRRLERGLYYWRDEEPAWESLAWAGVLLGGDRARLGGRGAGYLHHLLDSPPRVIPVLVPENRIMTPRTDWEFLRERPGVRSPRTIGGPPRLTIGDTVLDLCEKADVEQVVHLVTKAVQMRLASVVSLRRALAARQRMRHLRLIEDLLADVAEGAETPLELGYLRAVERAHELPRGQRQQHRHRR